MMQSADEDGSPEIWGIMGGKFHAVSNRWLLTYGPNLRPWPTALALTPARPKL